MLAATEELARAGIGLARLEARLLVGHLLALAPEIAFSEPDRPIGPADVRRLDDLLARRRRGEPLAYILGTKEFWSLPLRVSADVLIPRPDTETLVETALRALAARGVRAPRIVDLGTGSGCILLALLSEWGEASGIGVDRCEKALAVALENARRLGLERRCGFICGDWGSAIDGHFDLVVSNPPYIESGAYDRLDVGVRQFEPVFALLGGDDGLCAYRRLGPDLGRLLGPGASAAIEVGDGQAASVSALFDTVGLRTREVVRDLAGIERCLRVTA